MSRKQKIEAVEKPSNLESKLYENVEKFFDLNPNWSLGKRILMWFGIYIVFLFLSASLIVFFGLAYWTR